MKGTTLLQPDSTIVRVATTLEAGLFGFAIVGIYTLLVGRPQTNFDTVVLVLLFVAAYVAGILGTRRLIGAVWRDATLSRADTAESSLSGNTRET